MPEVLLCGIVFEIQKAPCAWKGFQKVFYAVYLQFYSFFANNCDILRKDFEVIADNET